MAMNALAHPAAIRVRRSTIHREYVALYCVMFAIALPVVCLTRLLPARRDPFAQDGCARRSVIAEARDAASITVGFAFAR